MEFLKILFKMIRFNGRSYMLYLYCHIFTMSFLLAFLSVCSNNSLMHNYKIDSAISNNILAPAALVCLFTICFLPYAYETFLKERKQEYSILMILGMTEAEVMINMFIQCLIVSSTGCIIGLAGGSGLAFLFFLFLCNAIGLTAVQWEFHMAPYAAAIILYAVVILVNLLINAIQLMKANLSELLKAKYKEEQKKNSSLLRLVIGGGIFFISLLVMLYVYYSKNTDLGLLSMGISIIGIAVAIYNFDSGMPKDIRKEWKISICFLLQYVKSWKTVTFLSACLFSLLIFFSGLSITLYSNSVSCAINRSPYDLFYVQNETINQISQKELERILNSHGVSINSRENLHVLRNGAFNIISVQEINKKLGKNYQADEGTYIQLFQEDFNDGYEHSLTPVQMLEIPLKNQQKMLLRLQEQKVEILFNSCKSLADMTIIVNDKDYQKIKNFSEDFLFQTAVLINLDNWKISGPAIASLQNSMAELNNLSEEDQYLFSLSSKIETYTVEKQASQVFIFWILFVDLMFFAAANVTIYFKIKSEFKEEKRILWNLYRIGLTYRQMQKILLKKNFCCYFPALFLGSAFGIFYNFSMNAVYHYGHNGLICAVFVSLLIFILQFLITTLLTNHECSKTGIFD